PGERACGGLRRRARPGFEHPPGEPLLVEGGGLEPPRLPRDARSGAPGTLQRWDQLLDPPDHPGAARAVLGSRRRGAVLDHPLTQTICRRPATTLTRSEDFSRTSEIGL